MKYIHLNGNKLIEHLHKSDGIGLFVYDRNLTILEWNECMEECTGILRSNSLRTNIQDTLGLKQEVNNDLFERALLGESYTVERVSFKETQPANQPQLFDLHFYPLEEADHKIESVMVLMAASSSSSTITLAESIAGSTILNINDFLRFAPIPIFVVDAELQIKLANKAFYEFTDIKPGSTRNLWELVPKPILKDLQQHIRHVIDTGEHLMLTSEYSLKKRVLYVYKVLFPVRNLIGEVNSVGGYLIDISKAVSQRRENRLLLEETLRLNEKLNEQNQELQQKKEELDQANEHLRTQKEELERVVAELSDRNYELDQIMYKTSHDLRAPLTSILGLLQLAKQEKDPDKLPEYHQYIENRINKLDEFVKTMLTYARSSRSEIALAPICWEQLVEESLEHLHFLEHYHKIKIVVSINEEIYPFESDRVLVNIILNNLIGNAVKYADLNKESPQVQLRINNSVKGASIEVTDNGIGISQEYIDKVCDMFFRATERSEGSGLGLYIVKQTVERLLGTLTIDSIVRQGTTFSVFLPHLTKDQQLKTARRNGQHNKKKV